MQFTVHVAGKTDVGCVRTNNEDNFGYDTENGIFVVCDGMGGAAAGEVASKLAVSTMISYFRQAHEAGEYAAFGKVFDGVSPRANALASAIQLVNQAIRQAALADAASTGMGTTIVAVLVKLDGVAIAHVGDSRIYLIRQGVIQQLTNDHSLVMEEVRRGVITAEQAEQSALQSVIVRALGAEDTVEPDLADLETQPDDVLLLCSDGLIRHVNDPQILETVTKAPTLEAGCDGLIEAAKNGGGSDNVTCLLVRFEAQPWYRKLFSTDEPKAAEPA